MINSQEPKVCVDRVLPDEHLALASEAAAVEREGNLPGSGALQAAAGRLKAIGAVDPHPEALVMLTAKKWRTGRTLKWHFLDGPEWARARVFELASRWLDSANLVFERTESRSDSDVRVTFSGNGSWSYLGTDNLLIPKDEPTMCLGWLLDDPDDFEEWRRVVVHEAGHLLDFGHEHQHPGRTFQWNEPAVYDYYTRSQGWSREEVYRQVLRTYAATVTTFSAYNKWSIMEYPIPASLVMDPADAVGWNTSRSAMDKRYAALWYEYPEAQAEPGGVLANLAGRLRSLFGAGR